MADAPREVWVDPSHRMWTTTQHDARCQRYVRADLAAPQVPRENALDGWIAALMHLLSDPDIPAHEFRKGVADLVTRELREIDVAPAPEEGGIAAKYNELIMAVARKFPDQTRHQTALRYIQQAEAAARTESGAAQTDRALKRDPK